jgi:hypothetical protein
MMHHVPRTRLTVLAVAGPVERKVRQRRTAVPSACPSTATLDLIQVTGALEQQIHGGDTDEGLVPQRRKSTSVCTKAPLARGDLQPVKACTAEADGLPQ